MVQVIQYIVTAYVIKWTNNNAESRTSNLVI